MRPRRRRVTYEDQQEILKGQAAGTPKVAASAAPSIQTTPLIEFQEQVSYVFELGPSTELKKVEVLVVTAGPTEKQTKAAFKKKKKYSVSEWEGDELGTVVVT